VTVKNNQNIEAHVNDDANADTSAIKDMKSEMELALCTYITNTLLPPESDIDLKSDDDLLTIDYLDSMQFMRLVQFTEDTYTLKIPPEDLVIENFQTVARLTSYLTNRKIGQ